jgi:uncharacterized protein YcnI
MRIFTFLIPAALAIGGAVPAFAHVTLERQQAAVGGGYKAVFRVPHGCDGSATTAIRIQIPEGVISVKPQPKPGWQIHIVTGKYGRPYTYYGNEVSEGVKEIDFTGNLPDSYYDELVLNTYLTDSLAAGSMLYFPVVQECENGVERWIQIPEAGKKADDYPDPAPGVKLTPADPGE